MRYVKPLIAKLGAASDAIQGNGVKNPHIALDAFGDTMPRSSGGAYDLDE